MVTAFLMACSGEGTGPSTDGASTFSPSSQSQNESSQPCFTDDCATPQTIATIPDAENMVFGPGGRLFVTGGTNVFEIQSAEDAFQAVALAENECNFTGITFIGSQLYAACGEGSFWTASLNSESLVLRPFYQIDGMGLANGLVSTPDGDGLLVADGPLPANNVAPGRILKIALKEPGVASSDSVWLDLTGRFPNGLQRRGRAVFISESVPPSLGQISRVNIGEDGLPSSEPTLVASLSSIPDDFSLLSDGFVVTLFFAGVIAKYGFDGNLQAMTSMGRFETGTSQVRVGQAPDFLASDVLVTVKGLLGETQSPVGNKLVLYRRIN